MRSVRQYEMMIIIDPSQDERTVAPSLDKFLETVRKDNGTVEKVDIWGKRRLEYPINKQDEGIYAVIDLNCESATVQELDRLLNLNEIIMRTKVLRKDAK
ncbi:MAG TPA: 30S ribosomal protein S6 [Candidatus Corynebacterium avicola]|uniref:Small ribosomal subunit protein bS6 n=1 Tax=Candidatus Corynebacterium avicola TaxID=2838527 RepID=A0A9D1RPR8_9CORY|nr:30S ribosomal protein S6 [Candidatus Corynebacterium avicola]